LHADFLDDVQEKHLPYKPQTTATQQSNAL